jgi:hypothetical protein
VACDFFCSDNWRVEKDSGGCEVWVYDHRPTCQPLPDAGGDAPSSASPEGGDVDAVARRK